MDHEHEDHRPRYRLCQAGFALTAFGLGLLALDCGLYLATILSQNPGLKSLRAQPWWDWAVGSPITWGTVAGAYLLFGRWADPAWRRRAGLLLLLNSVDLLYWALDRGDALNLYQMKRPAFLDSWLVLTWITVQGWVEFGLIAALAAEVLVHLGRDSAEQAGRTARTFAAIGLGLELLYFLMSTNWDRGWPLVQAPLRPADVLLFLTTRLVLVIAALQVCALCLLASRQCAQMVRDLNQWEGSDELLKSRSEGPDDPWA